jgi:hypothetical protein
METNWLVELEAEFQTLENRINTLGKHVGLDHVELNISSEIRQDMLTDEILGIYNAKTWYLLTREYVIKLALEDALPSQTKKYILEKISPKESEVLAKFDEISDNICKHTLDKYHNDKIENYLKKQPNMFTRAALPEEPA